MRRQCWCCLVLMLSWRKEAPGVRNISQHCVPALSCRGHLSRRHVTSCVTCHVSRVACPVSRAARNTLIIKRKQGSQEGTKPGIIPSHQAGKSIPFTLASTEHWAWMELLPSASEALLQQSPIFLEVTLLMPLKIYQGIFAVKMLATI